MSDQTAIRELDLSDAELMELLRHHGISRRGVMKLLGTGAALSAVGGTAAGQNDADARIDEAFGAPYAADESPPRGLIDHESELRGPPASEEHDDFPVGKDTEFYFDPVGLHVNPETSSTFQSVRTTTTR